MKQRDWGLLLVLIAMGSRKRSGSGGTSSPGWSPYGPFPEGNSVPVQPNIPPNPLEPKK